MRPESFNGRTAVPDCPSGCLCDDCCRAAREFAYKRWRLSDYMSMEGRWTNMSSPTRPGAGGHRTVAGWEELRPGRPEYGYKKMIPLVES